MSTEEGGQCFGNNEQSYKAKSTSTIMDLNTLSENLNARFDQLMNIMSKQSELVQEHTLAIDALKKTSAESNVSMQAAEERISTLEDETRRSLSSISKEVSSLKLENTELWKNQKCINMKIEAGHQRSILMQDDLLFLHFRIEGIPERGHHENTRELAVEVLKLIDENATNELLDQAFRENSKKTPRPIHISFKSRADAYYTVLNKSKLNKSKHDPPIYINQITTHETMRRNSDFRSVIRAARDVGIEIKLRNDHVIHEGKKYHHDDLVHLPSNIASVAFKTTVTSAAIGFRSQMAPLSNHFPCKIMLNGIIYNCAEQAIQHQRALLLKDAISATRIMEATDPVQMINICKHLNGPIWLGHRTDIVYNIILEKYLQNHQLLDYLLGTGTRHLVECTYGKDWGGNINLHDKRLGTLKFDGQNLMGSSLMTVRSKLRVLIEDDRLHIDEHTVRKYISQAKRVLDLEMLRSTKDKTDTKQQLIKSTESDRIIPGTETKQAVEIMEANEGIDQITPDIPLIPSATSLIKKKNDQEALMTSSNIDENMAEELIDLSSQKQPETTEERSDSEGISILVINSDSTIESASNNPRNLLNATSMVDISDDVSTLSNPKRYIKKEKLKYMKRNDSKNTQNILTDPHCNRAETLRGKNK